MKVSILMPTYNHAPYIVQAIESVLAQKANFDFELIIGDDFSTDGTREIVIEYARQNPTRIKLALSPENLGPHGNMMQLFPLVTGSYVALLEGDDYWTDQYKLMHQVAFLEQHPQCSLCFTNGIVVDEGNNILNENRVPSDKQRDINQRDIISGYCPPSNTFLLKTGCVISPPPAWYKCFNGDFIYAIHATDSAPAGYLNRHTAAYRKHTQGIWSSKSETYITVNFAKTCQALLTSYRDRYEEILLGHISACYQKLLDSDLSQQLSCQRDSDTTKPQSEPDLVSVQDFTVDGYWTPQTKMLQVIKAWLETLSLPVSCALSIDVNPDLDRMLTGRWPDILITRAVFPEYDVQNMYQIPDNSFDVVYSHQVLEHVPRPWLAGAEMVRALKPGGIGIHTSCAFNPRHGQPDFNDYYRFLPDGLEQLFDGVTVLEKGEWGNRQAILYNVAIDDGYGSLGGRRFHESIGHYSDGLYPWHTWIIFQKLP